MINRREFFGLAAGAGATLAFSPALLRALQQQQSGKLIQRAIPSSGEMLPAIGLAFSNHPNCADHAALKEVVKTYFDNGGKYLDATLGNTVAEQFHITAATELGIQNKVFWSAKGMIGGGPNGPPPPGSAGVKAALDAFLEKTKASKIDVAWLGATGDPSWLAAMKEEKKAGRVRYIGVNTIVVKAQSAQVETIMRNEPIDFIGVDYDLSNRHVEDVILPLALEKKIAVVAYFPFSNNSGVSCNAGTRNLFARVGNRPVPEWAAEFDAKTWSHFFTKYVLGHPAVTVARIGTTKASHMLDNMGGGVGRLPNEAMRKRMREFMDALPPLPPVAPPPPNPAAAPGIALSTAVLDRYVGEWTSPAGMAVTFRRDGERLFVKPGNNPEVPLNARSETRLQDPRGPVFEFQLDAQGKVTGVILEQQGPQGMQKLQLVRK
jgi:aryl-alcohol dehydrogenase-like predicted oxidoreductase